MISYGSVPRTCDRAKTYLYLKEWANNLFEFKNTKRKDAAIRVLLYASVNNDYVEGSAQLLHLCGQTVRNHLKNQDPARFLQVNQELVDKMKKKNALSKPLILA